MKTILITGGTNGIGKGLAMHYLKNGDCVIVVGSSSAKGEVFYREAKLLGAEERAVYIQADLSTIKENQRIIKEVKSTYNSIDMLILCAQYQKNRKNYTETQEGFEYTFGLYYLSRYILSYGLMSSLENSETPVIINVCAPGMNGVVNWDNLQYKNNYNSIKAMMHGSRLNDLLGVAFNQSQNSKKIKYLLFNPGAVQTEGAMEAYEQPVIKFLVKRIYKLIGRPVEEAIKPIIELIGNPTLPPFSAFKQRKEVNLNMKTFDIESAQKLSSMTREMIEKIVGK